MDQGWCLKMKHERNRFRSSKSFIFKSYLEKYMCINYCINYVLLHKQIIAKLRSLKEQICIISPGFRGLGIWELLSWMVLAQELSWSCNQNVSEDCCHLKAWPCLVGPLPKRLWLTWLLAKGLSPLSCRPLHRGQLSTGLLRTWSWLPPEQGMIEREREKVQDPSCNAFHNLIFKVTY